jgi:glycerol-3-phosphate dehydrogenase
LESPAAAPSILGSKGAHIAIARSRVANRGAVTMLHPRDGRVMFTLPADEWTIVGTTETRSSASPEAVRASREDVRYLLEAANAYFPGARLGERDVIACWAGIRPLAATLAGHDAGAASREHALTIGALGIRHITGGKLTTYRAIAEEVVDEIVDAIGRPYQQRCRTHRMPLPGGGQVVATTAADVPAGDAVRARLVSAYGDRWQHAWELVAQAPSLGDRLSPSLRYLGAELVFAVTHELAMTLGDVLIRRTRAAFEMPDHAMSLATRVAALVSQRLAWDAARQQEEVLKYALEVERIFGIEE